MPDIALRRDLCEEKVIDGLARLAATPQRLSMLYLLTIADSRATGPEAWSEWKASLVRELYVRTLGVLENGIFIFSMLLVEAMPLIVEMGAMLDLFVGIFVTCIIINHINRAFSSMDTRRLVSLKE